MKRKYRNIHVPLRLERFFDKLNFTGLIVGSLFYCLSFLPSLMPRPWLYQGVISGVSLASGYGIGVLVSMLIRWFFQAEFPRRIKRIAWYIIIFSAPLLMTLFTVLGTTWQNDVARLVGQNTAENHHSFRIVFIAVLFALALLYTGRLVRIFNSYIIRKIDTILPKRVSILLSAILLFAIGSWIFSGVFVANFVSASNRVYSTKNTTSPPGVTKPESTFRSGGPESLVPWETLGYQGKAFVGRGPTQDQLKEFSSSPVKQPIRVYSGVLSAPDAKQRAKLAVSELIRTKAFERKVLVLATATGTGWLEPQSTDSIEYMYGGDTAIVAQQYSYLPSWISFLVDKENATEAGQELFNAVYSEWSKLPRETRPKLVAYGLSLGSFGGQSAYSGAQDVLLSTDGAIFVGTPSSTLLWKNISNQRTADSPQWQPTYEDGKSVRFASNTAEIESTNPVLNNPHILYLQHANDPVVWFSYDLLLHKPDWLAEKRGTGVSPSMRWYPIVTFLQVAVDQFFGTTVPVGQGHNYSNIMVSAWASVVQPPDWNQEKSIELQRIIGSYKLE